MLKDLNHPSVIFYSIGNEIPETGNPLGSELGRLLAEKVRSLDPTRFVTNGVNGLVSTIDHFAAEFRRVTAAAEQDGGCERRHGLARGSAERDRQVVGGD